MVLANVPSFRFSFLENIRMYPRSSFRGNIRQNHPLENHAFVNPQDFAMKVVWGLPLFGQVAFFASRGGGPLKFHKEPLPFALLIHSNAFTKLFVQQAK